MSIHLHTVFGDVQIIGLEKTLCISEHPVTQVTMSALNTSLYALNPFFCHLLLLFFSKRSLVSPLQKLQAEKDFEVLC